MFEINGINIVEATIEAITDANIKLFNSVVDLNNELILETAVSGESNILIPIINYYNREKNISYNELNDDVVNRLTKYYEDKGLIVSKTNLAANNAPFLKISWTRAVQDKLNEQKELAKEVA